MALAQQDYREDQDLADAKSDKELADKLIGMYAKHNGSRRAHALDVQMNLYFLNGEQWVKASRSRGVIPIANSVNESRVTVNLMWDAFCWRQEMLTQERPVPTAVEGGMDTRDAQAALVAARFMRYWYDKCGLEAAMEEVSAWTDVCGISYISPVWRNSSQTVRKRKVLLDEPKVVVQKSGLSMLSFVDERPELVASGDIAFDVYTSLQVQPLPADADCWNKVNAVMIADVVDETYLHRWLAQAQIKSPTEPLQSLGQPAFNFEMLRRVNAMVNPIFGSNDMDARAKLYLLLQYRERPCKEYPNGRYIIVAGDQIVYKGDLPHIDAARDVDPNDINNLTLGLVPVFANKFPGKLVPPSPVSTQRGPQVEYNIALTDQKQNRETIGRNRFLAREGTMMPDALTDEHGQVLTYQGGDAPTIMTGQPLVGIDAEIQLRLTTFNQISGRPEVLQGVNLPQVRSSWHMSMIRQAALWSIARAAGMREKSMTKLMQLALSMAKKHYSYERMVGIYGEDNLGDIIPFFDSNLRVDVTIEKGSLVPRSHAEFKAQVVEAYQYGMFIKDEFSQSDNERVLKMLEMGSMNLGLSPKEQQRRRIDRENAMFMTGEMFAPFEQDDDDMHITGHMAFMQTVQFQRAPESVKQVFYAHTDLHNQRIAAILVPETPVPPPGDAQAMMPPGLMQ